MRKTGISSQRGALVIVCAFIIPVLFLFAGAAFDYIRWQTIRSDMVSSMDAATMAMIRMRETNPGIPDDSLREYGIRFFRSQFRFIDEVDFGEQGGAMAGGENDIITFDFDQEGMIIPGIDAVLRTKLLPVAGLRTINLSASSEITAPARDNLELALVLDVSGSMNIELDDGTTRMTALQNSANAMLDILEGQAGIVRIAVVPFNQTVNPVITEGNNGIPEWIDTRALAAYHGARFFHTDENGEIDLDKKVNHFHLFNSVREGGNAGNDFGWNGCIEARPYPLDELDVYTDSLENILQDEILRLRSGGTQGPAVNPGNNATLTTGAFKNAPAFHLDDAELVNPDNMRWVPVFLADAADCNEAYTCTINAFDQEIAVTPPRHEDKHEYIYGGKNNAVFMNPENSNTDTSEHSIANTARTGTTGGSYFDTSSQPDFNKKRNKEIPLDIDDYNRGSYLNDHHYTVSKKKNGSTELKHYLYPLDIFRRYYGSDDLENGISSDDSNAGINEITTMNRYDLGKKLFEVGVAHLTNSDKRWNNEEHIFREAYTGWWVPGEDRYRHKYEFSTLVGGVDADENPVEGPNFPDCPPPVLALTEGIDDVRAYLNALAPGGNSTNYTNGLLWGWRMLSPGAPFSTGLPLADNPDLVKAVVIMTDGVNETLERDTHREMQLTAYGYPFEQRMGTYREDVKTGNSIIDIIATGEIDSLAEMEFEMNNKLLRICSRMRDENYIIYAIQLTDESPSIESTRTQRDLRACVSNPDTDHYFNPRNADELTDVFREIANDVNFMRISG